MSSRWMSSGRIGRASPMVRRALHHVGSEWKYLRLPYWSPLPCRLSFMVRVLFSVSSGRAEFYWFSCAVGTGCAEEVA